MAKINTNSNTYTIIYASVMVIIVAFLLAFVSQVLKPTQDANVAIDKKSQILSALNIRGVENVEAEYANVVVSDVVYGATASDIVKTGADKDEDGFTVDNKAITATNRPLYVCNVNGATKYVIPVKGAGLWGGLWGYIAIDEDCETVYGCDFSHESETAGLGDRIVEDAFADKFVGKKLFAESNYHVALSVVKKGKQGTLAEENYVDGITGATLTCDGVNAMIQNSINLYLDILTSLKK